MPTKMMGSWQYLTKFEHKNLHLCVIIVRHASLALSILQDGGIPSFGPTSETKTMLPTNYNMTYREKSLHTYIPFITNISSSNDSSKDEKRYKKM